MKARKGSVSKSKKALMLDKSIFFRLELTSINFAQPITGELDLAQLWVQSSQTVERMREGVRDTKRTIYIGSV